MAKKQVVASALDVLMSDEFEPSNFSDNAGLHALVTEYFTGGSDDTDDDISSDEEEMCTFASRTIAILKITLFPIGTDWMNTASTSTAMNDSVMAVNEGILYNTNKINFVQQSKNNTLLTFL